MFRCARSRFALLSVVYARTSGDEEIRAFHDAAVGLYQALILLIRLG